MSKPIEFWVEITPMLNRIVHINFPETHANGSRFIHVREVNDQSEREAAIREILEYLQSEPFNYGCEGGISGTEWAEYIEKEFLKK